MTRFRRVLVTGGAGFIGYHTAVKLRKDGSEIALLDNFNDAYDPALKRRNVADLIREAPLALYEVDILDVEGLRRCFEEFRPQAVVHLAARAGVRPSLEDPAIYSQVNVTGTVNVLEMARRTEVESLIFASSSSVYGGNTKIPFSEEDAVDHPVSPYAATKRAGELLCHTYSRNYSMHITCLRLFTAFGPRQRPDMAIHKFARLIWEGMEVPVFGNGRSRRDYTFVEDIVSGILGALRVNPRYGIYNLGESRMALLSSVVEALERALGKKALVRFLPDQPGDMQDTCADIRRARSELGYEPHVSFEKGMEEFVEWFLRERQRAVRQPHASPISSDRFL